MPKTKFGDTRRKLLVTAAAALSMGKAALAGEAPKPKAAPAAGSAALAQVNALKGKIIFKGQPRYEAFRQAAVWNALKPNRFPEAIVMAETVDDVVAAVKLAKARGWQVATRSGGHSWVASHLRNNAILINITKMKELAVDPVKRIATVSPAWQGQAFNKVLREQYDLMFPTGHCYGIGLGGFILAGGHGWNSRTWGPGCAQLVALDLVNADGELIHASETENSDYLWAARGGGAGFPGVAVRFYLKVYPRPRAMKISIYTYPIETLDEVLPWFGDMLHKVPKFMEVYVRGRLLNGAPVIEVFANTTAYSEDEADKALDILDTCPALAKAMSSRKKVPVVLPPENESPNTLSPTGARYVTDGVWTNATTAQIVERIKPFFTNYPTKESWYLWMAWGEVQKLPDMAYSIQGHSYLSPNGVWYDPADDQKCAAWANKTIDAVRDISNGGQMNDDNMAVNKLPYLSPAAAERLKSIQGKYDPRGRFAGFLST